MKKSIAFFSIGIVFLGSIATTAFAATTTPATSALLTQLTQQIADLRAKKAAQDAARMALASSSAQVSDTLRLIGDLKEGMSGDDVKLLQTILAGDNHIYPEQNISGYYGKLTAKAIRRFQKKYGISATGGVGPRTRAKLNELLGDAHIAKEHDDEGEHGNAQGDHRDDHGDKKHNEHFCLAIPPGHLIAPGWRKHHDNDNNEGEMLIARCMHVPTTASDTPPIIAGITTGGIGAGSATINWTTNELALSKIYLSATSPVATGSTPTWSEGSSALNHSATLTGLSASTSYFFIVEADDLTGNKSYAAQGSFTTTAAPDTVAPTLSAMTVTSIATTSATINWTTNEAATSKVYYSTTTPVTSASTLFVFSTTLTTAHGVSLTGLTGSTTYAVMVESKDAANNTATSSPISFTTTP